jgi:predicted AlkP superfamily phosphohydrolase/phosphomutase
MKVLVIGIDGMDRDLVRRFRSRLPVLSRLAAQGVEGNLTSIFPPDSTPAWASIFTGETPARHGVINFVNLADKAGSYIPFQMDDSLLRGRTFWDLAGAQGKKVSLCLPFNIYPGWEVNGCMICRNTRMNKPDHPLSIIGGDDLGLELPPPGKVNMRQGFYAQGQLGRMIEQCAARTEAEAALALSLMRRTSWDLFVAYFSALDAIQHYFWNFFDQTHPNYPGENAYEEVIPRFYEITDQAVGALLDAAGPDVVSLVFSDHGHGVRPYRLLNLNEILRREGFLQARKDRQETRPGLRPRIKKILYRYLKQYGADYRLMRLAQLFPFWKRILASPSPIDWERTRAYVSDLSTVKSYSYGGIRLNNHRAGDGGLAADLLRLLADLKDPDTFQPLVKWACRREDLYRGPYINRYPEILLELQEGCGLGWEINCDLFGAGDIHHVQPGAHKLDTPVLFIHGPLPQAPTGRTATLMDLAPTILDLLGIAADGRAFDGLSLFDSP